MTKPPVHRFAHQAMGTFFEVTIAGEEESYAAQAAQAVFREIERIESLFSRFNAASEISQLNRLKPGESLLIGIETFECLTVARTIQAETHGAFNINVGSQLGGEEPFPLELIRTNSGFEAKLKEHREEVPAQLAIDLGGIGKGYALDRALGVLADWSIENALIHAGTSTAIAIGSAPKNLPENRLFQRIQNDKSANESVPLLTPDHVRDNESNLEHFDDECSPKEGWPVGVGGRWPCPDAPREIWLSGRAVSGSGTEVKGKHIIDPRTGGPAKGHIAAWASHPSATTADALSTAFMVMTIEEVEDYCRHHPDVWALVVRDYGDCRMFGSTNP